MAAMHSAANLSRMNVHDVRRIATGLEIHHRENGIRLKKHDLIQKILVKQIAGETDYASASKGTSLPAQESHLERKDQALPVGKAGKKLLCHCSLFLLPNRSDDQKKPMDIQPTRK